MKTYGNQGWTLDQVKAELEHKTNWGRSVVADLVAEIERLQALVMPASGISEPGPGAGSASDAWLRPLTALPVFKQRPESGDV
jgi:hypothetical protein